MIEGRRSKKVGSDCTECFDLGNVDASIIRGGRLRAAKSQVEIIKRYKCGRRLLNVGCGEAFPLFHASQAGYTAKGIELSRDGQNMREGNSTWMWKQRRLESFCFRTTILM